jgi:hypothetical protein
MCLQCAIAISFEQENSLKDGSVGGLLTGDKISLKYLSVFRSLLNIKIYCLGHLEINSYANPTHS